MASSMTVSDKYAVGNKLQRNGTGNLGTYATGGIAVTAAQLALSVIDELMVHSAGGYVFEWDKANGKVKAYLQKAPADLGASDIPLPELGAVDISATTFRWTARGH